MKVREFLRRLLPFNLDTPSNESKDAGNQQNVIEEKLEPFPSLFDPLIINWGRNMEGNLGRQNKTTERKFISTPGLVDIGVDTAILQVSARAWHTVIITDKGGYGIWHGNLGLGHVLETVTSPNYIPDTYNMGQCATGEGHTLFLRNDCKLFGCGWNMNAQLPELDPGRFHNAEKVVPRVVQLQTQPLEPGDQIRKIVCGYRHSIYLTEHGQCYIADKKGNREVGFKLFQDYEVSEPLVDVDATMHTTILLTKSGKVFMRGHQKLPDEVVQLQSTQFNPMRFSAVSMGRFHALILSRDGQLICIGDVAKNSTSANKTLMDEQYSKSFTNKDGCYLNSDLFDSSIRQISAGRNYNLVLTASGNIYSFGTNTHHQLGRELDERDEPVVGTIHLGSIKPKGYHIAQVSAGCDSSTVVLTKVRRVDLFIYNLLETQKTRSVFIDVEIKIKE
ncbi:E3 ubiquitin-protein ligase HERC [Acrasis kona]|uniref:E3 ubiquitin-protein ligase HERC n=1 Tax=Acrasis kona TaxID=1008807 RepID=A0AAW2YRN5_9EUKA